MQLNKKNKKQHVKNSFEYPESPYPLTVKMICSLLNEPKWIFNYFYNNQGIDIHLYPNEINVLEDVVNNLRDIKDYAIKNNYNDDEYYSIKMNEFNQYLLNIIQFLWIIYDLFVCVKANYDISFIYDFVSQILVFLYQTEYSHSKSEYLKGEVQTCIFSVFDIWKHIYPNNYDFYYKNNNIIRLYILININLKY